MVATLPILTRNQVIEYVGQHAAEHGVDPAAMLAVANHEGLNTAPGSSWQLPKEPHISFGPPSWYGGGAGAKILEWFGSSAPAWAWTPAGLDYWMQQVAASKGVKGATGVNAIAAIVNNFERPREDLAAGEITNATKDYAMFHSLIYGPGVTTPVPNGASDSGGGFDPTIPSTPLDGGANVGSGGSAPSATKLADIGPWSLNVPSGLVVGVLGVLLLLLGAALFAFNVRVQA